MARLSRPPRRQDDEERVLPLVNIVFLLLIFFMLAGRLAPSDPFEVEPARSERAERAEERPSTLLVGTGGRLALDGAVVDEAALIGRLAGASARRLVVRADARVEADRLVRLFGRLRGVGVAAIELQTARP
ncbi:MAG: ExbD/TolR family protein [Paracoccaceae bacterium]